MHPSLRFWDIARKAFVAGCMVIASGVETQIIPHPWDDVGIAVLAVAGYFGVYATRNVSVPAVGAVRDPAD